VLAVTTPEQPPLLLPVRFCMRKLAVFLALAGVGLVKAASLLTPKVACPLHHPCEHPRHGTYHPASDRMLRFRLYRDFREHVECHRSRAFPRGLAVDGFPGAGPGLIEQNAVAGLRCGSPTPEGQDLEIVDDEAGCVPAQACSATR
jgi:hypothetical protein